MPAARAAPRRTVHLMACAERPTTRSAGWTVAVPFSQRTDGARDVALDEAHVGRLAVGVGLAAADGDEQAALLARVGDVPPLELDGFRTPQPAHEEQPDDDAVDGPALGRELRGLPTSADGRPARRWPPGFTAEQGAA